MLVGSRRAEAGPEQRSINRHDVRRPVVGRFQDAALTRFIGLYFSWALSRMVVNKVLVHFVQIKMGIARSRPGCMSKRDVGPGVNNTVDDGSRRTQNSLVAIMMAIGEGENTKRRVARG